MELLKSVVNQETNWFRPISLLFVFKQLVIIKFLELVELNSKSVRFDLGSIKPVSIKPVFESISFMERISKDWAFAQNGSNFYWRWLHIQNVNPRRANNWKFSRAQGGVPRYGSQLKIKCSDQSQSYKICKKQLTLAKTKRIRRHSTTKLSIVQSIGPIETRKYIFSLKRLWSIRQINFLT